MVSITQNGLNLMGVSPFAFKMIVGAIILGLALWLELSMSPPIWVHALLWVPLATVLTLGLLRLAKAMLIAMEYRHEAAAARSETDNGGG